MNKKTLYWIIGILGFFTLISLFYMYGVPNPYEIKQCAIECTYDNYDCIESLSINTSYQLQLIEAKSTCMRSLRACINIC